MGEATVAAAKDCSRLLALPRLATISLVLCSELSRLARGAVMVGVGAMGVMVGVVAMGVVAMGAIVGTTLICDDGVFGETERLWVGVVTDGAT